MADPAVGTRTANSASESTAGVTPAETVTQSGIAQRPLARTGEHVSMLGIGGFHLGIPSGADAIRIVQRALDEGSPFSTIAGTTTLVKANEHARAGVYEASSVTRPASDG